jgi:hypothetical protein
MKRGTPSAQRAAMVRRRVLFNHSRRGVKGGVIRRSMLAFAYVDLWWLAALGMRSEVAFCIHTIFSHIFNLCSISAYIQLTYYSASHIFLNTGCKSPTSIGTTPKLT